MSPLGMQPAVACAVTVAVRAATALKIVDSLKGGSSLLPGAGEPLGLASCAALYGSRCPWQYITVENT